MKKKEIIKLVTYLTAITIAADISINTTRLIDKEKHTIKTEHADLKVYGRNFYVTEDYVCNGYIDVLESFNDDTNTFDSISIYKIKKFSIIYNTITGENYIKFMYFNKNDEYKTKVTAYENSRVFNGDGSHDRALEFANSLNLPIIFNFNITNKGKQIKL